MTTKVIITGASGRMGKTLIQRSIEQDQFQLIGATDQEKSPSINQDAGLMAGVSESKIKVSSDLNNICSKNRDAVIIDFTLPTPSLNHLKIASENKIPMVIGTTGFNEEEKEGIKKLSKKIPIVLAPNMSVGVNTLFKLIADAVKILGPNYDLEVIEAHHRLKKDAPSGTAVRIGEILAESSNRSYPEDANFHREGITGERTDQEIGMQTIRGGDIVGEHTIMYCGQGERLEIKHIATSRTTFADGALRAASWLQEKPAGLYDMQDVLGIKK
jgi:4-hydroxy-tetrahydrodipicolinate reductase